MSQREKATVKKLLQDAKAQIVIKRIETEMSVLGEVIALLNDPVRTVRFNAIFVLGEVSSLAKDGLPKLVNNLGDPDWSIRRETIRALGKFGGAAGHHADSLLPFLNDAEVSIREATTVSLGNLQNGNPGIINGLVGSSKDENESVRENAIHALGKIGKDAIPALEALMVSLKDPSWGVRQAAARALAGIGDDAENAIPVLVAALEDDDWRVRSRVVQTLIHIGLKSIPLLLNMVARGSFVAKKCAIEALGEMHASSEDVLRILNDLLSSKNQVLRGKVSDALRTIGEPAIPVLLKHVKENPSDVLGIWALGKMDYHHPEIIPVLVASLRTGNVKAKIEATRSIGNLTHNIDAAIPALVNLIQGSQPKALRIEATNTLGKLGTNDPAVQGILVLGLGDKVPEVRWRSAEALGKLGMAGAVDELKKLIHDREDFVASAALESLDKLES